MACDADTVEQQGGKLPDKEPLENIYGRLRSSSMSDDKVRIRMTEGSGFVTSNFYYQFSKAPASELSLDAWIDGSLLDGWNEANDEQRTLLPEGNYDFPDGKTLSLSAENQRSALKRIRFMAENLAPGEYYLPLTVAEEAGTEEHQTINYLISIRARQLGEYKLNADQVFAVFYLDTEKYQPLLVDEYLMSKLDANTWENAWSEREDGLRTIGNIVNLNKVVLDYDAETGRALLNLGNDMRYVLDHAVKYIRPLQEHGRKVCISIEGSGKGLGFCNLTDEQIVDFVAQVKTVVEEFGIDGINLWDRSAGYGKKGMPAVNTTSYPKLIKALREALGSEKLLTVTVYEEPTATFLGYEGDGRHRRRRLYRLRMVGLQQQQRGPAAARPVAPRTGICFGLYAKADRQPAQGAVRLRQLPIYSSSSIDDGINTETEQVLNSGFCDWVPKYRPNNIIVFDDLHSNLQDSYEAFWDNMFATCCTYMDPENRYLLGSRQGYAYLLDMNRLWTLSEGIQNYGKWKKDWN